MWRPKRVELQKLYDQLRAEHAGKQPPAGAYLKSYNQATGALPVQTTDTAQYNTAILPSVSTPRPSYPRTDEIDLRDIALPFALNNAIAQFIRENHALPDVIRMRSLSAYKLAAAEKIMEGYFQYKDPFDHIHYILIRCDDSLSDVAIELDSYSYKYAS